MGRAGARAIVRRARGAGGRIYGSNGWLFEDALELADITAGAPSPSRRLSRRHRRQARYPRLAVFSARAEDPPEFRAAPPEDGVTVRSRCRLTREVASRTARSRHDRSARDDERHRRTKPRAGRNSARSRSAAPGAGRRPDPHRGRRRPASTGPISLQRRASTRRRPARPTFSGSRSPEMSRRAARARRALR